MGDACSIIRDYLLANGILDEQHIVLAHENAAADTLISILQSKEESPIMAYSSGYAVLRSRISLLVRSPDRDTTWKMVSRISALCHNRTVCGIRMFRSEVRDGGVIHTYAAQPTDGGGERVCVESFLVSMEFRCLIPNNIID